MEYVSAACTKSNYMRSRGQCCRMVANGGWRYILLSLKLERKVCFELSYYFEIDPQTAIHYFNY
jgi:hypothetical protein